MKCCLASGATCVVWKSSRSAYPVVKASEEDEQMLKEMQRNAAFMDPTRAAAHLVGAQAAAMQSAASNQGAGPAMAFMGMNMAGQMGGMNAQNLYQMGAQQQAAQPAPAPAAPAASTNGWTCKCGKTGNTGKFCAECGSPKPADDSWTCALRRGEPRQVLRRVRQAEAHRPGEVRRLRLGSPGGSAPRSSAPSAASRSPERTAQRVKGERRHHANTGDQLPVSGVYRPAAFCRRVGEAGM